MAMIMARQSKPVEFAAFGTFVAAWMDVLWVPNP
jgi:hypothetical protein